MRVAFILADTTRTYIGHVYENEHVPFKRRVVVISLTPEQEAAIAPEPTGMLDGKETVEEVIDCFIDHVGAVPPPGAKE